MGRGLNPPVVLSPMGAGCRQVINLKLVLRALGRARFAAGGPRAAAGQAGVDRRAGRGVVRLPP
eukprot:1574567-Pyramimonas_sp.AAC.1